VTTLWVRIKSWHLVASGRTRCGRLYAIPSPTVDDLPLGAKSCETCLRLVARDAERASA
jgi:hypothetical protein